MSVASFLVSLCIVQAPLSPLQQEEQQPAAEPAAPQPEPEPQPEVEPEPWPESQSEPWPESQLPPAPEPEQPAPETQPAGPAPVDDQPSLRGRAQRVPARRPPVELTSWVVVAGGALTDDERSQGVFDLRLGGDFTLSIGDEGDSRLGAFAEAGTVGWDSITAVAGVELFRGAVPKPLRMFYFPGEGVLALRAGAGWTWRERQLPGPIDAPVASFTMSYGYRAPFSLRDYTSEYVDVQERQPKTRYMVGARLWLNAQVDLVGPPAWQVTGGIEVEPIGGLRYLIGVGY